MNEEEEEWKTNKIEGVNEKKKGEEINKWTTGKEKISEENKWKQMGKKDRIEKEEKKDKQNRKEEEGKKEKKWEREEKSLFFYICFDECSKICLFRNWKDY